MKKNYPLESINIPLYVEYEFTFNWTNKSGYDVYMWKCIVRRVEREGADKQAYVEAFREFYFHLLEFNDNFEAPDNLTIHLVKKEKR